MDAPVAALQSAGLLLEDGHGNIRNNLDRRAEFALKKAHEAVMSIKNSASIVSRAAIEWLRKLIQLLPEDSCCLLEGANRVLNTISFTSDATLDSMVFTSRAASSAAAARYTI